MLVLTRKIGEAILIDGDITIVVKAIKGGRVVLGLEGPMGTKIIRGELGTPVNSSELEDLRDQEQGEQG